jgi:hypothetical protein
VQCLDDVYSRVSGRVLKGGYIVVVQTHGRNGQYNPIRAWPRISRNMC